MITFYGEHGNFHRGDHDDSHQGEYDKIIVVDMAIINEVNILMTLTFSSMSSIESGKQLLPVGVATRELRREFASSIT